MEELFKSRLLIEDDEYYYFFRSLNSADRSDIANNITVQRDENGNIVLDSQARKKIERIRTDRERFIERFEEPPRYLSDSEEDCSLEQVFDHVKMHQRKDTNCISLSSNSNVTFTYYSQENPQYAIIRAKKNDERLINVTQYMMNEIEHRVNELILSTDNPVIQQTLARINNSNTQHEIIEIVAERKRNLRKIREFEQETLYKNRMYGDVVRTRDIVGTSFDKVTYLDEKQNLEIMKLIAKIKILEEFGVLNSLTKNDDSSMNIIATMKSALASAEYIYYGAIDGVNVERISTENLQAISLLQQYSDSNPKYSDQINQLILQVLEKNAQGEMIVDKIQEFPESKDISIDEALELTNSEIPYAEANEQIKTFVNLSRGRLAAIKIIEGLERSFGKNEIFDNMRKSAFLINPNIVNRQNDSGYRICESVNLISDLSKSKLARIVSEINSLSQETLEQIGSGEQRVLLQSDKGENVRERVLPNVFGTISNKYFAEAIVDSYDWKEQNRSIKKDERKQIIRAVLGTQATLKSNALQKFYEALERIGVPREEVPGAIINIALNKKFADINYYDLVSSENCEEILREHIDEIETIVKEIDLEILLGKSKAVSERLKKLGVSEKYVDVNSEEVKGVANLYWAERLIETYDWKGEIGRKLTNKEKCACIESILSYKMIDYKQGYKNRDSRIAKIYDTLLREGFSEHEAARFIIRGAIKGENFSAAIANNTNLLKMINESDYYKTKAITLFDIERINIEHTIQNDINGDQIRNRLIKNGFNENECQKKRTDNLYFAEYLVNQMQYDRKLSEKEKIAIMEQILDSAFFNQRGACKLSSLCENLIEIYGIEIKDIAKVLINISIDGVKKGIGYKKFISTSECFDQVQREDFNFNLSETTILETLILKKAREPKGKKYYYEKINALGIGEEKLGHVSEKDFCWAFEIFNSINFKDRLGRELTEEEKKMIISALLVRPTDGSTIQGIYDKLKSLNVKNIPEVIVNSALGNSGVQGITYNALSGNIEKIRKILEGPNGKNLNTVITNEILTNSMENIKLNQTNCMEELQKLGVRKDYLTPGNPNSKKEKNVYWMKKIVEAYDWEKHLGRKINDKEKIALIEKLLEPTNMNANMEIYAGSSINQLINGGIDISDVCGYLANISLFGAKTDGVNYTGILSNSNITNKLLRNLDSENGKLDEYFFERLLLEKEMENDSDGSKIYERMRQRGVREDYLSPDFPTQKSHKAMYFVEKAIRDFDFKARFGRELTQEEENAVIERMLDIDIFNQGYRDIRLDTTFDILRSLDLKGKDPLGVMLFMGVERIDSGKIKDPGMYYGKIILSEKFVRKIADYIDDIGDCITESTLRKLIIDRRLNDPNLREELYQYYSDLDVPSEYLQSGNKYEKQPSNLMLIRDLVESYDFEKELGRPITQEDKQLMVKTLLDNNYFNVERRCESYIFYMVNGLEKLGYSKNQIAGVVLNLLADGVAYTKLTCGEKVYERLEGLKDRINPNVTEETLEKLVQRLESKTGAQKALKASVDPKRNLRGRNALEELVSDKEKGVSNDEPSEG